jgi:ABC-type transport system substrate-binding protein
MVAKKWAVIFGLLIIASMVLAACPAPAPEVQTVVQTVVVKETVVETVKETVEVVKEVIEEKIVEVTPTPEGGQKVVAQWNLGTEPPTLDPSLAQDTTSNDVIENLFLGLTGFDEAGNVEPELATDWTVSDDGLVYTFNMRDTATWVSYTPSGGVVELGPVTAEEVVYGVKRTCNPETGSPYAYVDYIIKGCQDWNTADTTALSEEEVQALVDGVGVTAVDSYTVQFEINTPAPYFPAIAGMWVNRPQPQATIDAYGETWTEAGKIVTNGAYYLAEWFHNSNLTLEKNPLLVRLGRRAGQHRQAGIVHDHRDLDGVFHVRGGRAGYRCCAVARPGSCQERPGAEPGAGYYSERLHLLLRLHGHQGTAGQRPGAQGALGCHRPQVAGGERHQGRPDPGQYLRPQHDLRQRR